ncbi:hypothetical protein KR009_010972 [Drosophila setifemur]|nr:hypothetical protein KR009_010972 [Drosophila setifemur]
MWASNRISCILLLITPFSWAANYRLPTSLEPQHYDLQILTHLNATDQRFEGYVKIHLLARENTQNITLHSKGLRIDEDRTSINSQFPGESNCVTNIEVDDEFEFYTLHLSRKLEKGKHYQLEMHFGAKLNDSESGYYKSDYVNSIDKEARSLAVTQFSPTFARQAFPCFDEPNWKATFNITLGFQNNYTALSNMPELGCREHEYLKNYTWCEYEQLPKTSTYLVAYAVHDLKNVHTIYSQTANKVVFRNWANPGFPEQFPIEMEPEVLSFYENLFKLNFSLAKIDQFFAPSHRFTAMENWGLITYNREKFARSEEDDLLQRLDANARTVAHEYAHQWFGNMVTMRWWNDLWLKEGPSTYFAYISLDALQPEWGRGDRFIARDLANFFAKDSRSTVPAISKEVQTPAQILGQFSEYVYEKGALTMRMLHKLLGEEAFYQAIRSFLKRYSSGNADQAELWESLREAAVEYEVISQNFSLARAMDSWTLQGGYPLVTLIRDYKTGRLNVNQTRFYLRNDIERHSSCWWVPLRFVRQNVPDFNQTIPESWLECPISENRTLELFHPPGEDEWLILNPQVTTIFRVNYDDRNWRLINESLQNDPNFGGIHQLNRAQIIDDVLALASVQIQNYDTAFDLLEYLKKETDYLPLERSVNILNRLGALLKGQEAADFQIYMRRLLLPIYKRFPKLSLISTTPESIRDISFQRFVYTEACRYNVDDCILQTEILTTSNQTGFWPKVPSNFRELVYCSYLQNGGEAEFQELFELFQKSENPAQQRIWAAVLGCSPNFALFEQFLNLTLKSDEKHIAECYMLATQSALSRNHLNPQMSNHILTHAKELDVKLKRRGFTNLLLRLAVNLQEPEEVEQLNTYLKDLKQFDEPLKKALDVARINQQWQKDCYRDFSQALRKRI